VDQFSTEFRFDLGGFGSDRLAVGRDGDGKGCGEGVGGAVWLVAEAFALKNGELRIKLSALWCN
jgi:hypothetical protein